MTSRLQPFVRKNAPWLLTGWISFTLFIAIVGNAAFNLTPIGIGLVSLSVGIVLWLWWFYSIRWSALLSLGTSVILLYFTTFVARVIQVNLTFIGAWLSLTIGTIVLWYVMAFSTAPYRNRHIAIAVSNTVFTFLLYQCVYTALGLGYTAVVGLGASALLSTLFFITWWFWPIIRTYNSMPTPQIHNDTATRRFRFRQRASLVQHETYTECWLAVDQYPLAERLRGDRQRITLGGRPATKWLRRIAGWAIGTSITTPLVIRTNGRHVAHIDLHWPGTLQTTPITLLPVDKDINTVNLYE